MGRMKDIYTEVEYLYDDGYSLVEISSMVGVTLEVVRECISLIEEERDSIGSENDMDSLYADGEALASAGFGTDEDYGYYGEE